MNIATQILDQIEEASETSILDAHAELAATATRTAEYTPADGLPFIIYIYADDSRLVLGAHTTAPDNIHMPLPNQAHFLNA